MLLKDFVETKTVEKESRKKNVRGFCELCLRPNPPMQEDCGYTACCNELVIDAEDALIQAKQNDIMKFLNTKFDCSSRGTGTRRTFSLDKKNKEFVIFMWMDKKDIIADVKRNTKGLKKEF